jgi:hypothetical protein
MRKQISQPSPIDAAFCIDPSTLQRHPDLITYLPRNVRKALRVATHPVIKQQRTNIDVDQVIQGFESIDDPCDDAHYLTSNNIDADFDIDGALEFCDSDGSDADQFAGLTIVDPGQGNIRRWLKGYDIL